MVENHSIVADNNLKLALLGFTLAAIAPTISVVTGFVFQAGLLAIIVFNPPPDVPGFTVTFSLNLLLLPIFRYDFSLLYFKS